MTRPAAQTHGNVAGPRMFPTRHALGREDRERLVTLLNQSLADSFDLYTQTKQAHWNVKGMNFYQLHLLFDEMAEIVEKHVDLLAERATALGGMAMGTARMAARASRLPELPTEATDEMTYLEALIERYATHATNLGTAINEAESMHDKGTAEMLTGIVREVDQALYLLEAHTQNAPAR
jgi:starvation-inducible DNA-binding protein